MPGVHGTYPSPFADCSFLEAIASVVFREIVPRLFFSVTGCSSLQSHTTNKPPVPSIVSSHRPTGLTHSAVFYNVISVFLSEAFFCLLTPPPPSFPHPTPYPHNSLGRCRGVYYGDNGMAVREGFNTASHHCSYLASVFPGRYSRVEDRIISLYCLPPTSLLIQCGPHAVNA